MAPVPCSQASETAVPLQNPTTQGAVTVSGPGRGQGAVRGSPRMGGVNEAVSGQSGGLTRDEPTVRSWAMRAVAATRARDRTACPVTATGRLGGEQGPCNF